MAAVNAPQPGVNGKIYRNLSPTPVGALFQNAPVFTRVVANVRDVDIDSSMGEIDVTSRLGGGVEQIEPGILKVSFTLTMLHGPGNDDDMKHFANCFWTRTHVELLLLDQDINSGLQSSQGVGGPFKIISDPMKQPVNGMMEHAFAFRPCWHPLLRVGRVIF